MINRVTFARTEYARAPHRFEAGTPAIGAAIGMGAAARFLKGLDWPAATRHEHAIRHGSRIAAAPPGIAAASRWPTRRNPSRSATSSSQPQMVPSAP